MTFKLYLSSPSDEHVRVNYATVEGTAVAGADYEDKQGVVVFEPGTVEKKVEVQVQGDDLFEPDEIFQLKLSDSVNALVVGPAATGRIENDEGKKAPPSSGESAKLNIGNASVVEGDAGRRLANFNVIRTGPVAGPVSVRYRTLDGTASSPADYSAASAPIFFRPGERIKGVRVPVFGDALDEPDEQFRVSLFEPSGAQIEDGIGLATIIDDDGPEIAHPGGAVYVTGHDPEQHYLEPEARAREGASGNPDGAGAIIRQAVKYVTFEKPNPKILQITSSYPATTLAALGFTNVEFASSTNPTSLPVGPLGVKNLKTVDFRQYDAVVVSGSDYLTEQDAMALSDRAQEVFSYVERGGGLAAFEEAPFEEPFGFMPFLKSSAYLYQYEIGFQITPYGESMGLNSADVDGNISHQYFPETCDWEIVDVDRQYQAISLATRDGAFCGERSELNLDTGDERTALLQPGGRDPSRADILAKQDPVNQPPNQPPATQATTREEVPTQPFRHQTVAEVPPAVTLGQQQVQQSGQQHFLQQAQSAQQALSQASQVQQAHQIAPAQGAVAAVKHREIEVQLAKAEEGTKKLGDRSRPGVRPESYMASSRQSSNLPVTWAILPAIAAGAFLMARPRRTMLKTRPVYERAQSGRVVPNSSVRAARRRRG
ncbi:MAG: Calx-beta domain-containing protein [Actinomycetota bacterium]